MTIAGTDECASRWPGPPSTSRSVPYASSIHDEAHNARISLIYRDLRRLSGAVGSPTYMPRTEMLNLCIGCSISPAIR